MPQNLHTHQFFHKQISFSYQKLKLALKDGILSLMPTSKKIRKQSCVLFHKKHSTNAPQSRKNTGNKVLGVQGTTLKETKPNNF
jgi:hypothetical protein